MVCHALLQVRLEKDALDMEVIEVRMAESIEVDTMFSAVVQSEGTANMRVASIPKVEENRT